MDDNVISLETWKEQNGEHLSGRARCVACHHVWMAVATVGVQILTCPSCGVQRGYFVAIIERAEPHWKCACGNFLFFVTQKGIYCPVCAAYQVF